MIYLDENPQAFAERLGLSIETVECECGQSVIKDVPVRMRDAVGLITRKHGECKFESGTFKPLGEFKKVLEAL